MKDWIGNRKSIYTTIGASNHVDGDRAENDYYATDPVAIDKLLTVEKPFSHIWECAAGGGHLAKRLAECGFKVTTSDIVERDYKLDFTQDFLKMSRSGLGSNEEYDILTNPPYKYAKEFVQHSLEIIKPKHRIFMFLKLTFLEGKQRYKELFINHPPQKIYVFSERVLCAKNGDFDAMKQAGGSAVAYAWFIWEKDYSGKTEIEWI